ncbi:MAG: transketolase [Planctomycetaceae bacterium]|nr:transketolase [Planctomycetaceae bacterium]
MTTWTAGRLRDLAAQIRRDVLEMSHRAQTAHLGSSLSCVELIAAAYGGGLCLDPTRRQHADRDRLIFSKGHAATTLYAALARCGFFPISWLQEYAQPGSPLSEHPHRGVPGVEAATGSLGHGLSLGLGMALAARIRGWKNRVAVILSDGECNEGSTWEAALFAPAQRLGSLLAVIDYNKWQATGRSNEITALAPLADKWRAFGWQAEECDGHDVAAVRDRMLAVEPGLIGPPTVLIAHTVKGRGVSFMEDDNNWHYRSPNDEELAAALNELSILSTEPR